MARLKKPASHRTEWTKKHLGVLRSFAASGRSQLDVSQALGRTPAAIQQKSFAEGISFRKARSKLALKKRRAT